MAEKIELRLLREGKLKKQKAGFVQVEALLKESLSDLKEAQKIQGIANRATYMMAYTAMLKAGRALLLLNGFRPSDGAQHRTVVELTGHYLGKNFENLTDLFEVMRRKRNEMTYEAGALLSVSDSRRALKGAVDLVRGVLSEVKTQNPQLQIQFEE